MWKPSVEKKILIQSALYIRKNSKICHWDDTKYNKLFFFPKWDLEKGQSWDGKKEEEEKQKEEENEEKEEKKKEEKEEESTNQP